MYDYNVLSLHCSKGIIAVANDKSDIEKNIHSSDRFNTIPKYPPIFAYSLFNALAPSLI